MDAPALHNSAREILEPYFTHNLHSKKDKFLLALDKGKASTEIRVIIPAAVQGKVDTLFLVKGDDIFGVYDPSSGGISIQEEPRAPHVSLTNLAAKKVFEQGGTVYLMEKEEMPDNSSAVNALFRY